MSLGVAVCPPSRQSTGQGYYGVPQQLTAPSKSLSDKPGGDRLSAPPYKTQIFDLGV